MMSGSPSLSKINTHNTQSPHKADSINSSRLYFWLNLLWPFILMWDLITWLLNYHCLTEVWGIVLAKLQIQRFLDVSHAHCQHHGCSAKHQSWTVHHPCFTIIMSEYVLTRNMTLLKPKTKYSNLLLPLGPPHSLHHHHHLLTASCSAENPRW